MIFSSLVYGLLLEEYFFTGDVFRCTGYDGLLQLVWIRYSP